MVLKGLCVGVVLVTEYIDYVTDLFCDYQSLLGYVSARRYKCGAP